MSSLRSLADTSLPLIVNHLWSSTLFLLLILMVVTALRSRLTAGSRFSLALIGILKFVIPAGPIVRPLRDLFRNAPAAVMQIRLPVFVGKLSLQGSPAAPRLWPAIVAALWVAIALAIMLRMALSHRHLVALSAQTALPPAPREAAALARARRRVGVRRSIDVARSAAAEAPAVLRVFRPLVLLPANGCDELSDEELESLLCHECAHVARYDNLIARVESLICALFWFHPLIWIAQRITVMERERACDEVVAGSADERETYLAALTKFCHSAIAPRLPGVSCMATAKLNERINHVMNYETLKAQAPSPRRVTVLAAAALAVFTLTAGLVGTNNALAGDTNKLGDPYAIRIEASRSGDSITVETSVTENATQQVIAAPKLTLRAGDSASARAGNSAVEVVFEVRPSDGNRIEIDATISRYGATVQKGRARITPEAKAEPPKFTGEPISMSLKDANLRDVINTFGKLAGIEMRFDAPVEGTVSVEWINVPWDQAFDSLIKENGLTYRTEGKTIYVSRK
jgi:beta-lactamase regulating signal transducer with metallopeptidase domain